MNDVKSTLTRASPVPSEKILMYLMGLLFLISGIYGFYQYSEGRNDGTAIEGLLILLISLRIMSGDTPFGTFHRSIYLSILGSVGIIVSVFDLLLPYIFIDLMQAITVIILATYTAMCLTWAIKGRENNGQTVRILCVIFGLLMLLTIFLIMGFFEFGDRLPYATIITAMGLTMTAMAYTRTNFQTHEETEFPIASLTLLFTGIIMLCNVFAMILMTVEGAEMSIRGTMAVFLIILALRLISEGDTPLGKIQKSNFVIIIGIICMIISMVAVIIPSDILDDTMSYALGILNLIEGAHLMKMIMENNKDVKQIKFRTSISGIIMIIFGISALLPSMFTETFTLLTTALMSITMISLGITVFTFKLSEIKKFNLNCT